MEKTESKQTQSVRQFSPGQISLKLQQHLPVISNSQTILGALPFPTFGFFQPEPVAAGFPAAAVLAGPVLCPAAAARCPPPAKRRAVRREGHRAAEAARAQNAGAATSHRSLWP